MQTHKGVKTQRVFIFNYTTVPACHFSHSTRLIGQNSHHSDDRLQVRIKRFLQSTYKFMGKSARELVSQPDLVYDMEALFGTSA